MYFLHICRVGTVRRTHRNLYNLLLAWVHGRYRVLDAEVVRSETGGGGGE